MPQLDFISLVPIFLGVVLLFFGRKFFWMFVGVVAFMAVMTIVPSYVHHHESLIFYIALAVGVLAAVAGWFFQKVAVRIAGFLAGGYVVFHVLQKFAAPDALPWWLPFVIGGILGAILLSFLFEWALIVLSSLTGAFLILQGFTLGANAQLGLLAVLALIGIVVLARAKRGRGDSER